MEPLYLSKSRLNTYCQCPEKYKLRYIDQIVPEKTAIPLVEGSALHHIVENALVYSKVPNMAAAASKEYWDKIDPVSVAYESEQDFKTAQENVLTEAQGFLSMIGSLNCLDMESYFEHPLTNPTTGEVDESIVIRGYADLLDNPEDNVVRIIDIKTSAKAPSSEQANRCLELGVYAYLMAVTFGFHCEIPVSLLYLVRTKTPKVVWLDSLRKGDDFLKVYDTIVSISTAIRHGLFWKNQGMACSWCEYSDMCFTSMAA